MMPVLLIICAVITFPVLSSAAPAWDPAETIRAFVLENYPWAEVAVSDVHFGAAQPQEPPDSIVVEKGPPGKAVFRFDYRRRASVTAVASIRAFDRVLLCRAAFRKGYILRPDDIYPALMENGRVPKGAQTDETRVVGKPLLRSTVANAPVTDTMISDGTSVKRGRRVVLYVESPSFTIRTAGETKHDAIVGDQVKVLNLLSKKVVTGLLVDENTVRVGL